jgi:hypothetical protein
MSPSSHDPGHFTGGNPRALDVLEDRDSDDSIETA